MKFLRIFRLARPSIFFPRPRLPSPKVLEIISRRRILNIEPFAPPEIFPIIQPNHLNRTASRTSFTIQPQEIFFVNHPSNQPTNQPRQCLLLSLSTTLRPSGPRAAMISPSTLLALPSRSPSRSLTSSTSPSTTPPSLSETLLLWHWLDWFFA
jgi:hypothetical protein